jgi:hypothetical protein
VASPSPRRGIPDHGFEGLEVFDSLLRPDRADGDGIRLDPVCDLRGHGFVREAEAARPIDKKTITPRRCFTFIPPSSTKYLSFV